MKGFTVSKLLKIGSSFLKKKGSKTPYLDSEVLLSHSLSVPKLKLYKDPDQVVGIDKVKTYFLLLKMRGKGTPVAYITGKKEFFSTTFFVGDGVMIPRPETETLVELSINLAKRSGLVLDLCTGCGAIAISISLERRDLFIVASDISESALRFAKINVKKEKVESRVLLVRGDLFNFLKEKEIFDLVVSNPPYIGKELFKLAPEISIYEPKEALFGGEDGLFYLKEIVSKSHIFLKDGGYLLLETGGMGQLCFLSDMAKREGIYKDVEFIEDLSGTPRFFLARK